MNRRCNRRSLLRVCAGAAALVTPAARAADAASGQTIVFIRLRGGADGLNLIVPYTEDGYYEARPQIAIARPSPDPKLSHAAVALGDRFALNPALGWKGLFERKHMAAVVGVGARSRVVSHRRAQQELDALLLRAAGTSEAVVATGSLSEQLRQVADSLDSAAGRTVLVESTGWDTHVAQGGAEGRFAERARELGAAVLDFHARAERHLDRVRVAIVTEFGRTLSESPSHGTDDGYASVLFTLGPEQSGRVQGDYGHLERGCLCSERARAPSVDLEETVARFLRGEALGPS